jgi:hypothetical protein
MATYMSIDIEAIRTVCDHLLTTGTPPDEEGASLRAAVASLLVSLAEADESARRQLQWEVERATRIAADPPAPTPEPNQES